MELLSGLKLLQKSHIIFKEKAQIVDLVFKHGYTLNTHTESEAGILLSIYFTIFHYGGVYHTATTDLYPTGVFTHRAALAAAHKARYIHFGTRLGEGKEGRPEAYIYIAPEHFLGKIEHGLFEVGKGNILVNI